MNVVLTVLAAMILSSSAYAQVQGQPFRLEPGKYISECWYANVVRGENGEYRRNDGYEKGTFTSVVQGDVTMEIMQSGVKGAISRTITKVITTPLGDGLFKQTSETESLDSMGNFSGTARVRYETNMRVMNNLIQNVMVRYGEEQERPASGESLWRKLDDGRIMVQSYLREKTPVAMFVKGQQMNEVKIAANNLCVYTPQ